MSNESKKLRLTFCGAAGMVTGANFLLEEMPFDPDQNSADPGADLPRSREPRSSWRGAQSRGQKFLIDCGLIQGKNVADEGNWEPFIYDPKSIDALFITHAHIDHIGRIPKLIHEGFQGKIYSTPPTKDLAEIMLLDAIKLLKRDKKHKLGEIYNRENLKKAMALWQTVPYNQVLTLPSPQPPSQREGGQGGGETLASGDNFGISFKDAGHILGSAMITIGYHHNRIVFTGDIGNSPSPLLRDPEKITDANYLIIESVYGDRNHEMRDERKKILEQTLEDNFNKGGTLLIPVFSLERTQELLFEINDLVENKRVPMMPIFLDSPLAITLTDIYKKNQSYFNKKTQAIIGTGDNIFNFPGLKLTFETEESKLIKEVTGPKVIIAGSGMSTGGRIIHHEAYYLTDPKNTLLLTGYQALGTRGRLIEEGVKHINILGKDVPVNAKVVIIKGYSSHKDSDNLINFVQDTSDTVKKVFVTMGEPKSSLFLTQKIRDYLGIAAFAPELGESVMLDI